MKLFPSSSTHRIEVLEPDLLRKDLRDTAQLQDVRPRLDLVEDPRREPAAYRAVLGPLGIGPVCLDSGDEWIVVELIDAVELWQIGDTSVWLAVAGWLARLHARLSGASPTQVPLVVHDARLFAAWRDRAAAAGAPDTVLAAHERVTPRLLELTPTVLHGDFYPSNVLVRVGPPLEIWPIDWELMGWGPSVLDLAALTSGWDTPFRDAMCTAYLASVDGSFDTESWMGTVDAASLHLCVQWLGAPAGWRPPESHAQDWAAKAIELASRL